MTSALYRIIAVCLAVAWVPETMCCRMEAVGWDILCETPCCDENAAAEKANDGCSELEGGHYQSTSPSIKIAPSVATLCAYAICLRESDEDFETRQAAMAAEIARPRDWVPIWPFERRAAAPAHAPDWLIA